MSFCGRNAAVPKMPQKYYFLPLCVTNKESGARRPRFHRMENAILTPDLFIARNSHAGLQRCHTGDVEQVLVGEIFGNGVVAPATAT